VLSTFGAVTHSLFNASKRAFLLVSSAVIMRTHVPPVAVVGALVAVGSSLTSALAARATAAPHSAPLSAAPLSVSATARRLVAAISVVFLLFLLATNHDAHKTSAAAAAAASSSPPSSSSLATLSPLFAVKSDEAALLTGFEISVARQESLDSLQRQVDVCIGKVRAESSTS
jgi:hypothetical protein